jgi:hypothetical protein
MGSRYKYEETEIIREIAEIMKANKGPFTKMMLVGYLSHLHPNKYKQELKNEVANAILTDRYCNNRFAPVRVGWWDLKERVDPGQ